MIKFSIVYLILLNFSIFFFCVYECMCVCMYVRIFILGPIGEILANGNGGQSDVKTEKPKQTVKEYDLQQLAKLQNELFCEVISTTFLHFVSKAHKPLLLVPIMGIINKVQANLVQIHIFGKRAIGALKRPFTLSIQALLDSQVRNNNDITVPSM